MIQKESTTDSGHYTSCNCYCTSCSYHFEICSCYCATCGCHCSKLQLLLHQLQLSLWNLQLSVCNLQMSLHKYSWYCIVSSCHYETISCIVPVAAVNVHLHPLPLPTLQASERYRLEGNRLYADRRYEDAVEQYDMAIILWWVKRLDPLYCFHFAILLYGFMLR